MESSQNFILAPFPGIQVRLEEIKFRDFRQRERIGEPFLVLGGVVQAPFFVTSEVLCSQCFGAPSCFPPDHFPKNLSSHG